MVPNHNHRIEFDDDFKTIILKLSDGNPGAITALAKVSSEYVKIDPQSANADFSPLFDMDYLGFYGSDIWILFKNICGEDVLKFIVLMRSIQMGLLDGTKVQEAVENEVGDFDFVELLAKLQNKLNKFAIGRTL